MRCFSSLLLPCLVLVALGCDDTAAPADRPIGVDFGIDAGPGAHRAAGDPAASGSVLVDDFAVAVPDSLGGFLVLSFDAQTSDLFILQVSSAAAGMHECAPSAACHGRILNDVRAENGMLEMGGMHEIGSGSLTLEQVTGERIVGTFDADFAPAGPTGDTIVVREGIIDVPFLADNPGDARLWCLIGLTGSGPDCSG